MKISKIHSLGNDFLILEENDDQKLKDKKSLAKRICARHTGVGADGVLLISIQDREKGIVQFRIFNADGTEAELSGNGLRCAAAYLYFHKKISTPNIQFHTPVGIRECKLLKGDKTKYEFKLEIGKPKLASEEIPFDDGSHYEKLIDYPLSIHQEIYPVTLVNLGNPHCAIFVDRFPARIEWQQIGREIELHPFFPKRVNVEFIRVLNREEIEVFFWERGVGETLSSGSGSCAAAIASILKGLTGHLVKVRTSMGQLAVEWNEDVVFQIGPAELLFEGEYFV